MVPLARLGSNQDLRLAMQGLLGGSVTSDPKLVVAEAPRPFAGPFRRLSAGEVDELVEKYQGGMRKADLARFYGINESTVWKHIRDREIPSQYLWTEEQILEVVELYEDGATLASISEHVGRARGTVRRRLLEAGVELRSRGRSSREDNDA